MRKARLTRLQFTVVSALSITAALALAHISELRQTQAELNHAVQELTVVYDEHQSLLDKLEDFQKQLDNLQRRNEALEELLFNRARTYLVAVGRADLPGVNLLSRSGSFSSDHRISAVNMSVRSPSGLTATDFEKAWRELRVNRLMGTGEALVEAEKRYHINALVLAAIVVHESSWGNSAIARDKNNLAGLGAYDGSAYRSALSFDSAADSIFYLAALLDRHYVTPGGRYYHGDHLLGINKGYASDPRWAYKVAACMRLLARAAVGNPEALLAYIANGRPAN